MNRLKGKVAVVTGAGSGIGRATAQLFAEEGASLVIAGRTESSLLETMRLINAPNDACRLVAADLSVDGAADLVVQEAVRAFGRLDILVHAAAVGYSWADRSPGSMNDILETEPEKWREIIRINLDACYLICRAAVREMKLRNGGSIVNIASVGGMTGMADAHAYSAAKAGVINLTRSLCVTYAKENIRANTLVPGAVDTPMIAPVIEIFADPMSAEQITPMGRPGTALEMAYGCLYLASDEASYCNGAALVIDGGLTAR
jgi:NAD(P)-dependent dehydrogenase (short-subunit alcohol dehydrogenase family)